MEKITKFKKWLRSLPYLPPHLNVKIRVVKGSKSDLELYACYMDRDNKAPIQIGTKDGEVLKGTDVINREIEVETVRYTVAMICQD